MARPTKKELDIIPVATDYYRQEAVAALIEKYGCIGEVIFLRLLSAITGCGYYVLLDGQTAERIAGTVPDATASLVFEIASFLVDAGYYHRQMYAEHQVLTSEQIQQQYKACTRRRKNFAMDYDLTPQPQTRESPKPKRQAAKSPPPRQMQIETDSSSAPPIIGPQANARCLETFFSPANAASLEILEMNLGIPPDSESVLRTIAADAVNEWNLTSTAHRDYSDWSRHLIAVMRIKLNQSKNKKPIQQPSASPQPAKTSYAYTGGFGGKDI